MHGYCEVSTKQLERSIGVKQVTRCDAAAVQRVTGYQLGGNSPFGTRHLLPVYAEKTILNLLKIYINGRKRGFIVEIDPHILFKLFQFMVVEVAILSHR
jgi:Cys-tRNA(Pro) deacylase